MSDALEIHFLFSEDFEDEDKIELYERLLRSEDVSSSTSPDDVEKKLTKYGEAITNILYGSVYPTIIFRPEFEGLPDLPCLKIQIEQKIFDDRHYSDEEIRDHIDEVFSLILKLYNMATEAGYEPKYVVGTDPTETDQVRKGHDRIRTTMNGIQSGSIEEIYWLQILSPEMVENIGMETLQSAPAEHIEILDTEGAFLVSYKNPRFVGDDYSDLLDFFSLNNI
ncbi:hypothetical protein [Natrinema salaciae]|uniref:Uncharacterized protein n=1 Tax=Natrinema salaciae TaxID=1186196 RepID=A0A1H9EV67_9EURY|nr:hypothetical protein [Natrinema salaciae]SEQ29532.1 hypothetical protein SAMN04489841_1391 [Natrinema salaciae]